MKEFSDKYGRHVYKEHRIYSCRNTGREFESEEKPAVSPWGGDCDFVREKLDQVEFHPAEGVEVPEPLKKYVKAAAGKAK